jgi:GNAT superfamily N-acetyltransferase
MISITRVRELPADLSPLISASLAEGFRFLERLRDDWASGQNRFEKPGEAFYVARDGSQLLGVCGLNQDPFSGDLAVGRMRRLYVAPPFRRHGVGSALVREAAAAASGRFAVIRLRSNTEEGDRFWRARGFSRLPAGDPDATHVLQIAQEGGTFSSKA